MEDKLLETRWYNNNRIIGALKATICLTGGLSYKLALPNMNEVLMRSGAYKTPAYFPAIIAGSVAGKLNIFCKFQVINCSRVILRYHSSPLFLAEMSWKEAVQGE